MTKFERIKALVSSTKVGETFTRKQLLKGQSESSTLDNYRRRLEILGYIKGDGNGTYTVIKNLPSYLTTTHLYAQYSGKMFYPDGVEIGKAHTQKTKLNK
jgi:hypothetical protein